MLFATDEVGREHLVDYERSEIIYLVIRDQLGKEIQIALFRALYKFAMVYLFA